jgi:hypothetical protein
MRPYLEKPFTKTGLVEWLKVKALSSNPSTKGKTKLALHDNSVTIIYKNLLHIL